MTRSPISRLLLPWTYSLQQQRLHILSPSTHYLSDCINTRVYHRDQHSCPTASDSYQPDKANRNQTENKMAPNIQERQMPVALDTTFDQLVEDHTAIVQKQALAEAPSKKEEEDKYPFEWTPITKEEKMKRREIYYKHGPWCVSPKASMLDLIVSTPGKVLMPRSFMAMAETIYNFEIRPDDVFVVTYPKCGTTWAQEMVWQLTHNFDKELGKENLQFRSPFLEMQALVDPNVEHKLDSKVVNSLEAVRNLPSPRVIKTHLPIEMLPKKLMETCKVVFVARNPMDCCVSFYHHERLVPKQGFAGSFDQYAELFRNGQNPMGDYFYHLKSGWNRRDHPNLKFVWFEDMKRDLPGVLREMRSFLDVEISDAQLVELQAHLDIDSFRKNSSVNMTSNYSEGESKGSFIRKGEVGGWKKMFSEERVADWKVWVEQNTIATGIHFNLDV